MRHIWRFPDDLEFKPCIHKPTTQRSHVLEQDMSVETPHGTMAGRKGDRLMVGVNGQLYVVTEVSFQESYEELSN